MLSGNDLSSVVSFARWTHFSQFCGNFRQVPTAELKEGVINPSRGSIVDQSQR